MNIISTVFIVLAVSALTRKMLAGSKKLPQINNEGKSVLSYPVYYQVLGWVVLLMILAITIGMIRELKYLSGLWGIIPFSLLFISMSVYLILSRNCVLIFDEEKICYTDSLCRKKVMLWNEIMSVKFVNKDLVIKNETKKISINYSMIGFQGLLNVLQQKIDRSKLGDTQEKIAWFYEAKAKR